MTTVRLQKTNEKCLDYSSRPCSLPFISGDGFRALSDFIYDETTEDLSDTSWTSSVEDGSILFVKTDLIHLFFKYMHPRITRRYILVSHNSDFSAPKDPRFATIRGQFIITHRLLCRIIHKYCHVFLLLQSAGNRKVDFSEYLEDDTLTLWLAQNCDRSHPKLHPIPIGLENKHWKTEKDFEIFRRIASTAPPLEKRRFDLYVSLGGTNSERDALKRHFKSQEFALVRDGKTIFARYLADVASSKFVLSPRGNGLDCHRTWEVSWNACVNATWDELTIEMERRHVRRPLRWVQFQLSSALPSAKPSSSSTRSW